ncbi:hypothetical protein NMG60_11007812 [Bertholletia excelsa]
MRWNAQSTVQCAIGRGCPRLEVKGSRASSSSSKYSSPLSSSASPFSSLSLYPNPDPDPDPKPSSKTKTMEEVWKDISLASLHDPTRTGNLRGPTLQDFLSRPPSNNPPPTSAAGYGSPASPPATALRLNSGPDQFSLMDASDPFHTNPILQAQPLSIMSSLNASFDALAASSAPQALGKKRFPDANGNSGDRRHKRMIKNRESAARSRARKQERLGFGFECGGCAVLNFDGMFAYTTELEIEVAHLMEENARLKRQQQQLYVAAASQVPKKHSLQRTSTAPF